MSMQSEETNLYRTVDLGIAVFLFTTGHELLTTTLYSSNRLIFYFKRTEDIDNQVTRYLSGQGQAPAKRLFENYRALRALAFEKTGNLK